jgi:glycosyltransferase involved in cell wall biosynthesis
VLHGLAVEETGDRAAVTPRAEQAAAPELSVVSPCFNEAAGIVEFYRRVSAAVRAAGFGAYEIVLVDDGSTDGSWERIKQLTAGDPQVVGIRLSRNYGHQAALTAGLARARGKLVFVLDSDLQDPPELLSAMRDRLKDEGAEVVYGRRRSRQGETTFKRLTAAGFYRLLDAMTEVRIPLDTGDFRLMTKRMAGLLVSMPERDRFMRGMASWVGFKQVPYDYDRDPRRVGETKFSLRQMVRFASDAILGFSMLPLRLAGLLSALSFVALFGLLGYVLFSFLFLDTTPGWTSMALIVLTTSSVQLFTLAVISEYVGRIYMDSKRRPLFIIDEITGSAEERRDE